MSSVNYVTESGLKKMKDELQQLESVERPKVINAISEARDKGDLSENAEYDAAKEAQAHLEAKIMKLKSIIANSRIIDVSKLDASSVQLLTKVTILNTKNNAKMTYTIVPETEGSDLKAGKISLSTPIAKGLLGKKVGDKVDIKVPAGLMTFEVLDIALAVE
ncbi:MAG: transcription elongation factor GreA [Bacteroidales bacterium]|nr:transcription elongation factor GreA [Bacteroidales bacterium]MDD5814795.1 transcription elongation factor GreA [Bacteroidales bacterium]